MNTYLNMAKIAFEEEGLFYTEFNEYTIGVGFTNDDDNSRLNFTFQFDEQNRDCKDRTNHLHVSTYSESFNVKYKYDFTVIFSEIFFSILK